jgi:hypothetical protein
MKLLEIKPFVEVDKRKTKGLPFKPKTCTHCGKPATREFVFQADGIQIIEKYCDTCEHKG